MAVPVARHPGLPGKTRAAISAAPILIL